MGYFYDVPIWKQINKLTCTGEVRWACVDESCKKTDQSQSLWEINFLENRIDFPTVTNKFVPKSTKIIEKSFYLFEGIDLSKHVIFFGEGRLMDFDIDDFVVDDEGVPRIGRDTINAAVLDFTWKHHLQKGLETMATNIRFTCVPKLEIEKSLDTSTENDGY